jgi:glycerophosphoryl diester phosphodiesterase
VKAPLRSLPGFERIAHRGAPRECRENTLEGFLLALDRGADAVELDVHLSADGVPVVHHDFDVSGLPISGTRWEALAEIELAGGCSIPRLSDVLDAIGDRAAVYIELKGQRAEQSVVDVVRAHGRRYALHSFDHDAVARVAELAPQVPRGILLDRGIPDAPAKLREAVARIRPRDAWPHYSLVDAAFMHAAADLGVRVLVWTVNSPSDARRLLSLGVDGLCSDDLRLLADL